MLFQRKFDVTGNSKQYLPVTSTLKTTVSPDVTTLSVILRRNFILGDEYEE